jgi:hypothetical protein
MTDPAAPFDLGALSDEQLAALYKQADATTGGHPGLSGMPDADLRRLYAQSQAGSPDQFGGMTDTAARWMTFGLTDPVTAAGRAAVQKYAMGREEPWSDLYSKNLAEERGRAANFRSEHPYENGIAALAGAASGAAPAMGWPTALRTGAELPIAAARPTIGGQIGAGAGTGAAIGGVSGFANSQDAPLRDTAVGAGLGALVGAGAPIVGEVASVPLNAFSRRFLGGADSQALDRIANRIRQDARAGGPGMDEITQALAGSNGKPLSLADVAGENTSALAGRMTREPGEGREISRGFLAERGSGTAPRLLSDVDAALPIGSAVDTADALMRQRATAAAPLYDQAHAANTAMTSPEIDAVLQTPAGKSALTQARLKMANDESVTGPGIRREQPPSIGLNGMIEQPGDLGPIEQGGPLNLRTLDYVKRALDDQIGAAVRGGANDDARILTGLRRNLVSAMDNADSTAVRDANGNLVQPGLYKQARDAFAGPSVLNDALEAGQSFRSMRPEQIEAALKGYNPSEREFFRLGAADAMRQDISRTGDPRMIIGSNAVNQRGGDLMKQQLRPLFDNERDFNRFIDNMGAEALMLANTGKWVGNSATAGRLAEDAGGHGPAGPLVQGAMLVGAGMAGEPALALSRVPGFFASLKNAGELSANNPQVNAATARRLLSGDASENSATLADILARMGRPALNQRTVAPLATALGGVYPSVALPTQNTLAGVLSKFMSPAGPSERP